MTIIRTSERVLMGGFIAASDKRIRKWSAYQLAWHRRLEDLGRELSGREWLILKLQLREQIGTHVGEVVQTYWTVDAPGSPCTHDVEMLVELGDEDELHKWTESEDLICLASPEGETCVCAGDYCARTAEVESAREDFWAAIEHGASRGAGVPR